MAKQPEATSMNSTSINADQVFAQPLSNLGRFSFDEQVAEVFPDMIQRSVPGYNQILAMAGVIAKRYVPEGGRVYDLGASLGASTLSLAKQLEGLQEVEFITLDTSLPMVEKCQQLLAQHLPQRLAKQQLSCQVADVTCFDYQPCDFILLNFTLQFLAPEARLPLLEKLYKALRPGGALILSEKIHFANPYQSNLLYKLHHDFKRTNGYSDLEISQKRTALEDVLRTNTPEEHLARLTQVGFSFANQWFQYLNFASFLAIKGA